MSKARGVVDIIFKIEYSYNGYRSFLLCLGLEDTQISPHQVYAITLTLYS